MYFSALSAVLILSFDIGPTAGALLPVQDEGDPWKTSFVLGVEMRYGLPALYPVEAKQDLAEGQQAVWEGTFPGMYVSTGRDILLVQMLLVLRQSSILSILTVSGLELLLHTFSKRIVSKQRRELWAGYCHLLFCAA